MSTDHPESGYPPSTLFGRDAEIGQLRACLRAGKAGRGRLVLIGGEAGIGKTALVEEMAAMAEQDGMLVIRGACYDLATPPYGPWTEVLDDLALTSHTRQPPSLRPEGREGATPAAIRDAQTRLLEYLSTVADEQPLLIVLEDLHWSDPDSLSLTRYLSRALARRAVLVVVTYRDVELTADYPLQRYLPHLVRETRPLRISLQRFGREDIRAMSRARYALPDADEARLAAYLYDHAEGNPFFTEELLRSLAHDRRLACLGGRWRLGELHDAGVPLLVKQMIDARVAWMAPEARELLRIAAVIGADVPLALWRQVSGVSDEALALAVDHAREAQVVAAGPSNIGICFSHALVREAVYESVAPPQRQAWHRRIAELLAGEPVPGPDLVAFHFHQAGDPRAATWLVQAGTNALQSSAIEDAVERFQHALDLLPPDAAADRAIVLAHLADAHRYTHPDLALDYTDQARRLVTAIDDRAIATIVLWSRGRIRGFLGRASRDDLDEAIAAYRSLAPDDHTRIHAIGGRRGSGSGPFAQWLAHHGAYHDAIDVGLAATRPTPDGTSNDAGHAQFGLGLAYSGLGRSREGRSALEQARRQFTSAGNRFMASAALKWQLIESAYTWEADDLATRDALLREYDDIWSLVGDHRADASGAFRSPLFPPLIVEGRWDDARAAAETYLSDTYLRVDCLAASACWTGSRDIETRAGSASISACPTGLQPSRARRSSSGCSRSSSLPPSWRWTTAISTPRPPGWRRTAAGSNGVAASSIARPSGSPPPGSRSSPAISTWRASGQRRRYHSRTNHASHWRSPRLSVPPAGSSGCAESAPQRPSTWRARCCSPRRCGRPTRSR